MSSTVLRLNMPQWQGGDEPAYRFGAELLRWLAPPHHGPEETIAVAGADGGAAPIDRGIKWRDALLAQARAAGGAIGRHQPDRIVTLGGDCLVDLAPMAWLRRRYGDGLGVLWLDAHPDVMSAAEFSHAHAHVLAMLLGRGDADFVAEVPEKLDPRRVMIAGMQGWNDAEGPILAQLGLRHIPPAALAGTSGPVLDWIRAEGITHLAVHLDLDVLDPAHFSPLLFNRPDASADAFQGVEQGRMRLEQVMRLLQDVGEAADMVGLAITEHLPWDMLRLKNGLAGLPIMRSQAGARARARGMNGA
ncbi:MAG: arginase family protein [Paracoccus sp. (in: a-proteobacteria)]|uniref:arginase family protein n=1 Tax=Paracoccus sp. TaxID=267 RepID=UPI0026E0D17D|nr:arginase family protein [Paracoccus sp. (in: a-proteobacteria)]MDO5611683.1 arginase family protein [Paracoccus sp. (in: a-proteobacteria)]